MKNRNTVTKHQKTRQRSALYYLVALYIGYLGYSIMNNRLSGDDTLSYPIAIMFTCLYVLGAVLIALYATKQIRDDFKAEKEAVGKEEENN
jgi:TRAP-type C4-dicarboxylate transport system permease small subunit